jgi:hypothetical protein
MTIFDIFRPRCSCSRPSVSGALAEVRKARSEVAAAQTHVNSFNPLLSALLSSGRSADYSKPGVVILRAEDWQAVSDALGKVGGGA